MSHGRVMLAWVVTLRCRRTCFKDLQAEFESLLRLEQLKKPIRIHEVDKKRQKFRLDSQARSRFQCGQHVRVCVHSGACPVQSSISFVSSFLVPLRQTDHCMPLRRLSYSACISISLKREERDALLPG